MPFNRQDAPIGNTIFDFDGTLAELHIDFDLLKRRLARLAENYQGYAPIPNRLPALEWMQRLAATMEQDDPIKALSFIREGNRVIQTMELKAARRGCLFPFTRPILQELRDRDVKVAVVTRNCSEAVLQVFPDLSDYCNCLLARDHVDQVKPHPSHILTAMTQLGASRRNTVMIGDHPLDIESGKRVGIRTAAVATGRVDRHGLAKHDPTWLASDCDSLFHCLISKGLLGRDSEGIGVTRIPRGGESKP